MQNIAFDLVLIVDILSHLLPERDYVTFVSLLS